MTTVIHMKKLIPIAALACSVLLIGCGASNDNVTKASSNDAPARSTTTIDPYADYLTVIQKYFPGTPRASAISLGKTMCDTIDEMGSVALTANALLTDPDFYGMETEMGALMGISIITFCPEYTAQAQRYANS